jgi:hypothetical protein
MAIILTPQLIVGLVFLIMFSIFDFLTFNKKKGYIPSTLTTIFLIVMLILGGLGGFQLVLFLGVLASLIALLFSDLNLWNGIADFKIFVAGAMAFPDLFSMLIFATLVTIVAVAVKSIIFFKITKRKNWKFPFIPVILIAYIITGGII